MYKYRLQNRWGVRKGRGRRVAGSTVLAAFNADLVEWPVQDDDECGASIFTSREQGTVPSSDLPSNSLFNTYINDFNECSSSIQFQSESEHVQTPGTDASEEPEAFCHYLNSFAQTNSFFGSDTSQLTPSLLGSATFASQIDPEMYSVDSITHAIRHMTLAVAQFNTAKCHSYSEEDSSFCHEAGRSIYMRNVGTPSQSIKLLQKAFNNAINDPY